MKPLDKILDLDVLKEKLIFSNTPLYLYKHFRRNESIQELSKRYDSKTLIRIFGNIMMSQNDDLISLVSVYSIIIALTFKEYSEVRQFFLTLDSYNNLKWSRELKEIFFSYSMITQIYRVNLNYKAKSSYDLNTRQSSSNVMSRSVEPKISIIGEAI